MPNVYKNRTFEEQAQYELLMMAQDTYPIAAKVRKKAREIIARDAKETKGMGVSAFVDQCIEIARLYA